MSAYLIIFRILHILAAIAWAGSAFFFFVFVEPTTHAIGPQAEPFMTHMVKERKIAIVVNILALVTLVAGGFLYWHDSGGFDPAWITSDIGLGFTIGAIAAIIAFAIGLSVVVPNIYRLTRVGDAIKGSGGPPTEEQLAAIGRAQRALGLAGRFDITLIGIAAVLMATARYLSF